MTIENPIPISAPPAFLAQEVIAKTPRLAAALMQADKQGLPFMVSKHGKDAAETLLDGAGMVAKWATAAKLGGVGLLAGVAMSVGSEIADQVSQKGSISIPKTAIHAIYTALLGPEDIGSLRPPVAAPQAQSPSGQTDLSDEEMVERREAEMTMFASSIVSNGFENRVDRNKDGGAFDMTVLKQVRMAADVVAPNQSLSNLSPVAFLAIGTAAVQASTPAYLKALEKQQEPGMAVQSHLGARILTMINETPDSKSLISSYMKQGVFDEQKFELAIGDLNPADGNLKDGVDVAGLRKAMLTSMASKAKEAMIAIQPLIGVTEGSETQPELIPMPSMEWSKKMLVSMRQSLIHRRQMLQAAEPESERHQDHDSFRI